MELQFINKENIIDSDLELGLVLINIDACPIHIGLMYKGDFFELTVKGLQRYTSKKLFNWINIKKHKCCLISFGENNLSETSILELFNGFSLENENTTCLDPIKHILTSNFKVSFLESETIFDVLSVLRENQINSKYFYLGSDDCKSFNVKTYTRGDVFNHIKVLR